MLIHIQIFRAIAVLLVILFHYQSIAPFGYIGVDFFFLISGYLVGGKLIDYFEAETFSLKFFTKRINRILPNLIFYLLFYLLCLFFIEGPISLINENIRGIRYASFSISNVFFWSHANNYFSIESEFNGLLHTWSLSLEEQFYVVLPLLLWISSKLTRKVMPFIWLIFIISLSLYTFSDSDSAKFYLLSHRLWEFALGIFIYKYHANALHVFGYTLPILASYYFNKQIDLLFIIIFTYWFTLCNSKKFSIDWRYLKPLVYVGNISYSLYLSHYFLLVLFRIMRLRLESYDVAIIYFLLTFVLAAASYQLVEQKFRNLDGRYSKYFIATLILIGLGAPVSQRKSNKNWEKWSVIEELQLNDEGGKANLKVSNDLNDGVDILILGDSHVNNFRIIDDSIKFSVAKLYSYGCPTLMGVFRNDGYGNWCNCMSTEDNSLLLEKAKSLDPKYIVLALRYDMYLNGLLSNGELQQANHYIHTIDRDGDTLGYSLEERKDVLSKGILETINLFKDSEVILSNQLPDLGHTGSMKQLYVSGIDSLIYTPRITEVWADSLLSSIAQSYKHVHYFDNRDHFLKDKKSLRILTHGDFTYRDDNHASYKVGLSQGRKLIKFIEEIGDSIE